MTSLQVKDFCTLQSDRLEFGSKAIRFGSGESRQQSVLLTQIRVVVGVVDVGHDSLPGVENIDGRREGPAWPDVANEF